MEDLKKILPTIYNDAAKPSVQKIGIALSSIVGLVVSPLGKAAEIGEKNLTRLIEKLNRIEKEKIVSIPPELGVPIFERLKFTRGEELVELYTELFIKASTSDTQNTAHPSYLEIITNLSVDEAKIVRYLKKSEQNSVIPYIRVKIKTEGEEGDVISKKYLTNLTEKIEFFNPNNEQMYLENLTRLGLLHDFDTRYLTNQEYYKPLLEHSLLLKIKQELENTKKTTEVEKSYFVLTDFGKNFLETCVPL